MCNFCSFSNISNFFYPILLKFLRTLVHIQKKNLIFVPNIYVNRIFKLEIMNNFELNCQWYFAEALGGQDQGPNEAMSETFKKLPYASLVRESLQNSVDAQLNKNQPVLVSFDFKETKANQYPQLFKLKQHIYGCLNKYNDQKGRDKFNPMIKYITESQNKNSLPYLEVSDFNTTGMDYRPNDTRSGFYNFVKCAGNSSKSSTSAGGSFGFGKAAYFNVSKLRTVLVSTLTDNKKYYFEGISSLCTHEFEGKKRVPVGFYTETIDEEPINLNQRIPPQFRREETGTTVAILGIDYNEMKRDQIQKEIIRSVLLNFWLTILDGKLVVIVGDQEPINASNLREWIEEFFAKDGLADGKRVYRNPYPYLCTVLGARSSAKVGDAANCKIFKKKLVNLGDVEFFMFKHKDGVDKILCMRSPRMHVTQIYNDTNYGFFGVFLCDDPIGNEILRHCENSQHNEWDFKNFEEDKEGAKIAIKEMTDFIQECVKQEFVNSTSEVLTFGGLEDYLYIPYTLDEEENLAYDNKQAEVGDYTGNVLPTGTIPTTIGQNPVKITKTPEEPKPAVGKVTVTKRGGSKDNTSGSKLGGHTTKPRKEPGGGGPGAKNPKIPRETDPANPKGSYAEPMEVGYRAYVQKSTNGELEHHIIIHTKEDAKKTQIIVLTGGDTGEAEDNLKSARGYKVIKNTIVDVPLYAEQTNHLIVTFEDDMPHAIRLDVLKHE